MFNLNVGVSGFQIGSYGNHLICSYSRERELERMRVMWDTGECFGMKIVFMLQYYIFNSVINNVR